MSRALETPNGLNIDAASRVVGDHPMGSATLAFAIGGDEMARRRWQQGQLYREGRYWKVRYSACFDRRPRPLASAIVGVMKFFSGYPQSKLSSEIVGWTAEYRQDRSGERSPNSKSALPDLPVVAKLSLA